MAADKSDRINLVYTLEGDVEQVDVFALGPAMMALGRLIQDSTQALNPLGGRVAVRVRPFRRGSFILDVVVFAQSAEAQGALAAGMLAAPQLVQVLKALGLAVDVKESVLSVLKKLKGKPKVVSKNADGGYQYKAGDQTINVTGDVHTLIQNPTIIQHINGAYGAPLFDGQIESIRSHLAGDDPSKAVQVVRADAEGMRSAVAPEDVAARLSTNATVVLLIPKRVAVDGDRRNWSFRRSSSDRAVINATIRDDEFLAKVASGEVRFGSGDIVRVELLETQRVVGNKLTSTYEILRVLEYMPGESEG